MSEQSQAVNLDEVVEQVFLVPLRQRRAAGGNRVRLARIRDYVPMRVWNRYVANRRTLPDGAAAQLVWMVQQIALVWRLSEPAITPYQLAAGLSYDQVNRLFTLLFLRSAPPAAEQSIERLNFATRGSRTGSVPAEAMRDVPLVTSDWDEEARQNLLNEAARVESRDPETAAFLRAQAAASLAQARTAAGNAPEAITVASSAEVYNATRLYSWMGTEYPWMSKAVIDAMHYPTFFGYVREVVLRNERQRQVTPSYGTLNAQSDPDELSRYFGTPARTVN